MSHLIQLHAHSWPHAACTGLHTLMTANRRHSFESTLWLPLQLKCTVRCYLLGTRWRDRFDRFNWKITAWAVLDNRGERSSRCVYNSGRVGVGCTRFKQATHAEGSACAAVSCTQLLLKIEDVSSTRDGAQIKSANMKEFCHMLLQTFLPCSSTVISCELTFMAGENNKSSVMNKVKSTILFHFNFCLLKFFFIKKNFINIMEIEWSSNCYQLIRSDRGDIVDHCGLRYASWRRAAPRHLQSLRSDTPYFVSETIWHSSLSQTMAPGKRHRQAKVRSDAQSSSSLKTWH